MNSLNRHNEQERETQLDQTIEEKIKMSLINYNTIPL